MIVLDSLLIGGIKFVLNKVVAAVDSEMNDESVIKEELLAAQMQLELGEITDEEFAEIESGVLARLRELNQEKLKTTVHTAGSFKVSGVEASFGHEETPPDDEG
jgi:hypothetical protein